ncbi:MAG: tetratricopeptide repeat protein [Cytophagales bacterium]|nr:tetratricopeptide repeat protein [Cytophagales bacterium]
MNVDRIKLLEGYSSEEPGDPFNFYALAMEYLDEAPQKSRVLLNQLLVNHPNYLPSYYKAAHLQWDIFENLEDSKLIFEKGIVLAQKLNDEKVLGELKASYQNLIFEME